MFVLRRFIDSVRARARWQSTRCRCRARAAYPRSFGTSAVYPAPASRGSRAATSAASAICGTAFGLTKLVTSKWRTPAASSSCSSSSFCAVVDEHRLRLDAVAQAHLVDDDPLARHGRHPITPLARSFATSACARPASS